MTLTDEERVVLNECLHIAAWNDLPPSDVLAVTALVLVDAIDRLTITLTDMATHVAQMDEEL
jgi:hypothetical protein